MTLDLSKLSDNALNELVLDYARGNASDDAKAAIEARLSDDPKLADEVAYLQGLHSAVSAQKKDTVSDEFGWQRLSKAIAAEQVPIAANDNNRFWKYAAAALAVVAALQTAFLVQPSSQTPTDLYVTASANDAAAYSVQVIFQSSATTEELTQALKNVEGEITSGPSALGLYTVSFETETARDEALTTLQNEADLIESVILK